MTIVASGVLASGAGSEDIDTSVAQIGDVLVVMATYPSSGTPGVVGPSDTTGWTARTDTDPDNAPLIPPSAARCSVWTKQFTSSPPASEKFENIIPGANPRNITVAYAILRGVDYASIDVPAHVTTTGNQTQISHPATTVGGSSDGHVILFLSQSDSLTNVVAPSGFTIGENESGGAANTFQGYVMYAEDVPAGAAGPFVVQFDSNFQPKIAFTVSFANVDESGGQTATVEPSRGTVTIIGAQPSVNPFTSVVLREVLINEAGSPLGNMSNMSLLVWYAGAPIGAPDLSYSDVTTDNAGTMSYNLAVGALAYNQPIFYVATDGNGSLSAWTCARMTPTYS